MFCQIPRLLNRLAGDFPRTLLPVESRLKIAKCSPESHAAQLYLVLHSKMTGSPSSYSG